MKSFLLALACLTIVIAARPASAQGNSCVYNYAWSDSGFGFCLTNNGTLYSLHGGQQQLNQLDPVNPIEGWGFCDKEDISFGRCEYMIPGLGLTDLGLPLVSQPQGPGKLPIVFSWRVFYPYKWIVESVTADPKRETVTFTIATPVYRYEGSSPFGPIWRIAQIEADGAASSSFQNSANAAFAFQPSGSGVMLTGKTIFGSSKGMYGTSGCTGPMPSSGGAICNVNYYFTESKTILTFEYKIF